MLQCNMSTVKKNLFGEVDIPANQPKIGAKSGCCARSAETLAVSICGANPLVTALGRVLEVGFRAFYPRETEANRGSSAFQANVPFSARSPRRTPPGSRGPPVLEGEIPADGPGSGPLVYI